MTPAGFDAAKELGVSLPELGCTFQNHLSNLQALIPQAITPDIKRGKFASLYLLGYRQFTTGTDLWPVLPKEREAIPLFLRFLKRERFN